MLVGGITGTPFRFDLPRVLSLRLELRKAETPKRIIMRDFKRAPLLFDR